MKKLLHTNPMSVSILVIVIAALTFSSWAEEPESATLPERNVRSVEIPPSTQPEKMSITQYVEHLLNGSIKTPLRKACSLLPTYYTTQIQTLPEEKQRLFLALTLLRAIASLPQLSSMTPSPAVIDAQEALQGDSAFKELKADIGSIVTSNYFGLGINATAFIVLGLTIQRIWAKRTIPLTIGVLSFGIGLYSLVSAVKVFSFIDKISMQTQILNEHLNAMYTELPSYHYQFAQSRAQALAPYVLEFVQQNTSELLYKEVVTLLNQFREKHDAQRWTITEDWI
jgi:hypothetical protein